MSCTSIIVAIQCSCLYNIFIYKNDTYSRHLITLISNYYVISEKYFYLILLHINITFTMMTSVLVATGTIMVSCFIHICGMFKIARLNSLMLQLKARYNYRRNFFYYIFTNEINKYIILCVYRYRFQTAMSASTLQDINMMNDFVIYRRIIYAIDIHRKAIKLVFI